MSDLTAQLNAALAGRYRIERELGRGGMAIVFLAEDLKHRRRVAIKVLSAELATALGPERFLREIELVGRQNHPHILPLYDSGSAGGLLYYVMPYAEGESLRHRLERERQLPVTDAVRIACEVADALDYAHRHGVVHRDIKPENILLEDQHAVVADFGIARAIAAAGGERMTTTGLAVGSPVYMSPEQAAGGRLDGRTDIYSLGCMLFEILAGQPPFTGATSESLAHQHLNVAPRLVTDLRPSVPAGIANAIQRALSKSAADRFATAAEFAAALSASEAVVSASSARTVTAARTSPRMPRNVLIGVSGALALAALLGLAYLLRWGFGASAARADDNSLAVFAFENLQHPEDPERLGQILQELTIADLCDLGSLKVLSSQRLQDVERQLTGGRRPPGEVSHQVAARAGARTLLTGTLSRLGSTWILTGQLVDVAKGTVITSARVDGTDLYSMIDDLTGKIRDGLRLRLADRGEVSLPVREKITPSLEALRHYVAGSDLLNGWDFPGAIEEYRKAVAIDSTFGMAEYRLAIALWWQADDLEAAREPLSRILSRNPDSGGRDRLMAEGALALINHCYGVAERRFEEVTRDYPDEKEAWYGLGEAWFHGRGGLEQARSAFTQAVTLDPDFTVASLHLADIERVQGRPDSARALLDRLIATRPQSPMLSAWRVTIEVFAGDEARAKEMLATALRGQANPAAKRDVCLLVTRSHSAVANWKKGYEIARMANDFDPEKNHAGVHSALGEFSFLLGRPEEAERWFLRGLESAPNDWRLVEALGRLYVSQGRFRELISRARDAVQKDPAGARAWYVCWAAAAAASGDVAEAERAVPRALAVERDPYSRRDTETLLAWALYGSKEYRRAEEMSRKAMAEVPECESSEPYAILGWSLFKQVRLPEAEAAFRKGLDLSPGDGSVQNGLLATYTQTGEFFKGLDLAKRLSRDTTVSNRASAINNWVDFAASLDEPAELDSAFAEAARTSGWGTDRPYMLGTAGDGYRRAGNWLAAARYYLESYSNGSPLVRQYATHRLGSCFENIGRYAEAERWFRRSLSVQENDLDALTGLLNVLIDQKRYPEAEEVAERCATILPTELFRPIEVALFAGRPRDADARLERTLKRSLSPELRRLLLARLATVQLLRSDRGRARSLADRAASLGPPGEAPIHERYMRGYLALAEGDFAGAESTFVGCRDAGAEPLIASYYVALARALAGKQGSAERELRALIERRPAHYLHYSLLSALLSERGRFAEAVPFAERAVAMDSSRTSLTLLAWPLVAGGVDAARGEALARLALEAPERPLKHTNLVYPFTPSLEQTLGLAALKRGDFRRSVQYLEAAARLRPDRPSIRRDLETARGALAAARPGG